MPDKILVVDDEQNLVELVKVNLEASGFIVITAGDGETGLKRALSEIPAMIILDVRLPKMDGWTVCEKLKNDDRTKNIPVVFLTAATQSADRQMAEKLKCAMFIPKPFDPTKLVRIIKKLLNEKI